MADDKTIIVPAALGRALVVLDKHYVAAKELTAAITTINEHSVDIDDDAMAEIEKERLKHSIAAIAIADALQATCLFGPHRLNADDLYNRACRHSGAKIVVEGASNE